MSEYKPTYEQLEKALDLAMAELVRDNPHTSQMTCEEARANVAADIMRLLAPPPPAYEEATVERWECAECGSIYTVEDGRATDRPIYKGENWGACKCGFGNMTEDKKIKLTGTRRVAVPQKVVRRFALERASFIEDQQGASRWVRVCPYPDDIPTGKTGTLTFEWEE